MLQAAIQADSDSDSCQSARPASSLSLARVSEAAAAEKAAQQAQAAAEHADKLHATAVLAVHATEQLVQWRTAWLDTVSGWQRPVAQAATSMMLAAQQAKHGHAAARAMFALGAAGAAQPLSHWARPRRAMGAPVAWQKFPLKAAEPATMQADLRARVPDACCAAPEAIQLATASLQHAAALRVPQAVQAAIASLALQLHHLQALPGGSSSISSWPALVCKACMTLHDLCNAVLGLPLLPADVEPVALHAAVSSGSSPWDFLAVQHQQPAEAMAVALCVAIIVYDACAQAGPASAAAAQAAGSDAMAAAEADATTVLPSASSGVFGPLRAVQTDAAHVWDRCYCAAAVPELCVLPLRVEALAKQPPVLCTALQRWPSVKQPGAEWLAAQSLEWPAAASRALSEGLHAKPDDKLIPAGMVLQALGPLAVDMAHAALDGSSVCAVATALQVCTGPLLQGATSPAAVPATLRVHAANVPAVVVAAAAGRVQLAWPGQLESREVSAGLVDLPDERGSAWPSDAQCSELCAACSTLPAACVASAALAISTLGAAALAATGTPAVLLEPVYTALQQAVVGELMERACAPWLAQAAACGAQAASLASAVAACAVRVSQRIELARQANASPHSSWQGIAQYLHSALVAAQADSGAPEQDRMLQQAGLIDALAIARTFMHSDAS